jgi:serine/threonine protein kinase
MATWRPEGWSDLRPLGEGGQSWTYLARRSDDSDQNQYVLKRLKNKERLTRFEREIDALRKLSHPGILRIVETADPGESPFYVAEYCEKGDLGKSDLSGKPLLDNLRLFRQVCEALAVAHDVGIIHRDLKPQNILIRGDDSIVVSDFGLCLDLNDIEERATRSSEAVGARHYIAPELEDGRSIDPKPSSDVYSLGKLLYYFLSGRSFARERHTELTYDLRKSGSAPELFSYTTIFSARPSFLNRTSVIRTHASCSTTWMSLSKKSRGAHMC